MPSPKAVLRDISNHNLNPKKPHNKATLEGRLTGLSSEVHIKSGLVQLPEELKVEPIVEIDVDPPKEVKVEENNDVKVEEQHITLSETSSESLTEDHVVEQPKKKDKQAKKSAKKDSSEDSSDS